MQILQLDCGHQLAKIHGQTGKEKAKTLLQIIESVTVADLEMQEKAKKCDDSTDGEPRTERKVCKRNTYYPDAEELVSISEHPTTISYPCQNGWNARKSRAVAIQNQHPFSSKEVERLEFNCWLMQEQRRTIGSGLIYRKYRHMDLIDESTEEIENNIAGSGEINP